MHVHNLQKIEFASKRTLGYFPKKFPEDANNRVKELVICYNNSVRVAVMF